MKTLVFDWTTIYANSDTQALTQPVTSWISCADFDKARATFELRGKSHADLQVRLVLQFCDYPNATSFTIKPLAAGPVGTDGITYPALWEQIDNESKQNQLVRVAVDGLLADATPGGLQVGRLSGRVEFRSC